MAFTKRQYEDYIASPAWEAKRERAFKKHGRAWPRLRFHRAGPARPPPHLRPVPAGTDGRPRRPLPVPCHKAVHRLHDEQRFRKGPNLTLTEVGS